MGLLNLSSSSDPVPPQSYDLACKSANQWARAVTGSEGGCKSANQWARAMTGSEGACPFLGRSEYSNSGREADMLRSDVPGAGVEPARCCHRQILSLVRLPFRHPGMK
jgi:hypothetical protein